MPGKKHIMEIEVGENGLGEITPDTEVDDLYEGVKDTEIPLNVACWIGRIIEKSETLKQNNKDLAATIVGLEKLNAELLAACKRARTAVNGCPRNHGNTPAVLDFAISNTESEVPK